MSVDTTSHHSMMKERLDESFKKQNARREGSLDHTSFFEGYSAGLQERDIVLEKLDEAEELILKLSTCLESHSNNNFEYELLKETEQFLREVEK